MERKPQTFANHAKLDPFFHFFLSPLALVLIVAAVRGVISGGTGDDWWRLGAAVTIFGAVAKSRLYALKVQDRIIRLEERLRLTRVLAGNPLAARVEELSEPQLIALRFAPDAELPDLVSKAVSQATPRQLKESIRNWRPDYYRV